MRLQHLCKAILLALGVIGGVASSRVYAEIVPLAGSSRLACVIEGNSYRLVIMRKVGTYRLAQAVYERTSLVRKLKSSRVTLTGYELRLARAQKLSGGTQTAAVRRLGKKVDSQRGVVDGLTRLLEAVTACMEGRITPKCPGGVAPQSETCNGIDDDCDGQIDEDLGTTTCGIGACASTVQNCLRGHPRTCYPKPPVPGELCNGADDNCNGVVDEGACQSV